MTAATRDKLGEAMADVLAFAAVLDLLQTHMRNNAEASKPLNGVPGLPNYRVHLMAPSEARAFDFTLTGVVNAAEDLRLAYVEHCG